MANVVKADERSHVAETRSRTPGSAVALIENLIWLVFGAVEVLLLIRFFLRLLGANPAAPFTTFIYNITGVLIAPFALVFPTPSTGGTAFELSTLLAMVVYALVAWGLTALIDAIWAGTPHETVSEVEQTERYDEHHHMTPV